MEIIDVGRLRVCVSTTRVAGKDYIDIRAHVPDGRGMLKPTSAGLLLPVEYCQEILDAADRECQAAVRLAPATLFYYVEHLVDKQAARVVPSWQVSHTAIKAVAKTPDEYGAEKNRGYIFKCSEYTLLKNTYTFVATKPFAVWDVSKDKWVRFKALK